MSIGDAFLWCYSEQWYLLSASHCLSLTLFLSLSSRLFSVHAAALRTVDGGCGGEALRATGERRGLSPYAGFRALWPVIHGGGCRRATRAHRWLGLHAGEPCGECQQVSFFGL